MTDPIAEALDAFVPAFESADGNWESILTAASSDGDLQPARRLHGQLFHMWLDQRSVKRLLAVAVGVAALAGTGVGIAAGFGAFSGGWNLAVSGNAVGGASPCGPSVSGTQLIPVGAAEGQWSRSDSGPIWVFALSTGTNISRDGDGLDGQRRYLHRTLIAVDPSYTGSVAIVGSRIGMDGPRTALRFTNGTAPCNILGSTWVRSVTA